MSVWINKDTEEQMKRLEQEAIDKTGNMPGIIIEETCYLDIEYVSPRKLEKGVHNANRVP